MNRLQHSLEIFAAISGIINVYLVGRANIWNWLFGIITVTLYAYLFYRVGLYADMGLQVVYLCLQVYGWQLWLRKGNNTQPLKIKKTPKWLWVVLFTLVIFLFFLLAFLLAYYTDSSTVILDALTTAISLVAQWMMCKKWLENWWLWIMVDIIAIEMYWSKQLYMTSYLYFIFLLLSCIGYKTWSAKLR